MGSLESFPNSEEWEMAERSFFKNKHGSIGAQKIHIHPARVAKTAREVYTKTYKPKPGYRFPIISPTPREIFASFCNDRLVHHYVAPFLSELAEIIHKENGDISHGNRVGHSAQTAAEQIRICLLKAQKEMKNPYIVKNDIRAFFMSIPREQAYDFISIVAYKHYDKPDREEKLQLCKILILHDPVIGSIKLGKDTFWKRVPERKLMEKSPKGCGLPIGNFYSQLTANLFLAILDLSLQRFGTNPRFVDDKCNITEREYINECQEVARNTTLDMGLKIHPDKIYIQPVYNGINFCGRTIKGNRIYLSNTTLQRIYHSIEECSINQEGALKVQKMLNSYLGIMMHCTEWKNEKRLADFVLDLYSKYLYFSIRNGHFICRIKKEYDPTVTKKNELKSLTLKYYVSWENYKQLYRVS